MTVKFLLTRTSLNVLAKLVYVRLVFLSDIKNLSFYPYIKGVEDRKVTRSPKVSNHEILGTQHLKWYFMYDLSFTP